MATLLVTATTVAVFTRRAPSAEIHPRTAGYALCVLAVLFAVRVVGQIAVVTARPRWLPPMRDWNLMPYRFLLPIQFAFLAAMTVICADLLRENGLFASPSPAFGRIAVWFSYAYALAMAVRYAVRMVRRPEQRWFRGTIPIVFHWVLATFVFVYGTFHASH